jgi:hypothetical protein
MTKNKNLTLTHACAEKTQWMTRKEKFNPNTGMCGQNTMNDKKGKINPNRCICGQNTMNEQQACADKTQWMTRKAKFNPNTCMCGQKHNEWPEWTHMKRINQWQKFWWRGHAL